MNNNCNMSEYNYYDEEVSPRSFVSLKSTQKKLKGIPNGELPLEMLKSVAKAVCEHKDVIETVCRYTDKWILASSSNNREEDIMNVNVKNFIEILKDESDFIKTYVFKEREQINLWIVIKDVSFENTMRYIKLFRENMNDKNCDMLLFEEYEEDDIKEQISYISDEFEEIKKNG